MRRGVRAAALRRRAPRETRGGEHLDGPVEQGEVLFHLLVEQAKARRRAERAGHLLAHSLLLLGKGVQRHLQIARHERLHLVAVEPDQLAQELDRQQVLAGGGIFRFEDDLSQNRAGDVLSRLAS